MASERQRRVQSIFESALKRDVADRKSFLDGACLGDPTLREEVESLLSSSRELDTAAETLQKPEKTEATEKQLVGPYRIIQEIGHGGMGVVYEAEQEKPVRRKVALKLIKWGMDTKDVIARFDSERQALALMNHPNIAGVYDAGASDFLPKPSVGSTLEDYLAMAKRVRYLLRNQHHTAVNGID